MGYLLPSRCMSKNLYLCWKNTPLFFRSSFLHRNAGSATNQNLLFIWIYRVIQTRGSWYLQQVSIFFWMSQWKPFSFWGTMRSETKQFFSCNGIVKIHKISNCAIPTDLLGRSFISLSWNLHDLFPRGLTLMPSSCSDWLDWDEFRLIWLHQKPDSFESC